jgi:hypothetical protein
MEENLNMDRIERYKRFENFLLSDPKRKARCDIILEIFKLYGELTPEEILNILFEWKIKGIRNNLEINQVKPWIRKLIKDGKIKPYGTKYDSISEILATKYVINKKPV